jgi:hypothetical protein
LISFISADSFAQEGGYVNSITVKQDDTLKFYISTDLEQFDMVITKYLNLDDKIRFITIRSLPGGLRSVPEDSYMKGCDWPETHRIVINTEWEPGMYRAIFPSSAGERGIIFFIRPSEPGSYSNILLVLNTNTWQAYNSYGGKNLYPSHSPDRSYKVSFLRPSSHNYGSYTFFQHELKFVDWIFNKKTAFEYASDYNIHSEPSLLDNYQVVVLAGHSEYWSFEQRDNFQKYINNGGKLMILSGNTSWWQVRFEDEGNTLVCYKDRRVDPYTGIADSLVTVNWYDIPVRYPENHLTGLSFRNGGYVNNGSILPSSEGFGDYVAVNTHHWIFEDTGLNDGDEYGYESSIVGNEVDGTLYEWAGGIPVVTGEDGTPRNYRIIGLTPAYNSKNKNANGAPGIYINNAGGAVFNAASIRWVNGLISDSIVSKITGNVLSRFLSNSFPPDILSWVPVATDTITVNDIEIPVDKRIIISESNENINFSVKAVDHKNSILNYEWIKNNNIVGTDSVYNLFSTDEDSLVKLDLRVFNSSDTVFLSWVIRTPDAGSVADVVYKNIHREFSLSQNYPNPFNPSTIIDFNVPFGARIKISIFSVTGEHISTILNEYRTPGNHSLQFNAGILPSGIYIYKIDAISESYTFTDYKKLVLIR